MAIKRAYERRVPPAGYYSARFTGVTQRDALGFNGEPVEKSIWRFVGHPVGGSEDDSYDLSVWVTNSMAVNSHQRKLIERMGGITTRDEMGALVVHPATVTLSDPHVIELCDTNCQDWEGHRFLIRVQESYRADGSLTSFSNVDDVYRAEGEPPLLPLKTEQTAPVSKGIRKGRAENKATEDIFDV